MSVTPEPDHSNGRNGVITNALYRTALLGICSWVLIAVIKNSDRSIVMEGDLKYFNTSIARIEGSMNNLVTKSELELTVMKFRNEQLSFQNEFLKLTQPGALATPQPKTTTR